MNRDKAIEAGARALATLAGGADAYDRLNGLYHDFWQARAAAVIDAAAPHLVAEADRGILRSLLGELMADRRRLIDYASIACSDDPPRALVLHARAEGIRLAMERIDGLLYLIPVDGP